MIQKQITDLLIPNSGIEERLLDEAPLSEIEEQLLSNQKIQLLTKFQKDKGTLNFGKVQKAREIPKIFRYSLSALLFQWY